MPHETIKVVIVDDSLFIRQMFSKFLQGDPQIEVVGTAADPFQARELIKQTNPDVITLDVEMPKMDGLSFLEKIMTLRPMPVVMISSLTQRGADTTLRALEIGAVDYIGKPDNPKDLDQIAASLIRKVKMAARINVQAKVKKAPRAPSSSKLLEYKGNADKHLIAIGASTGGVEAIRALLEEMPANIPPVVITQHMPAMFTDSFARRLDTIVAPHVKESEHGETIRPGTVYIAAGATHLKIEKKAGKLVCIHDDGPEVTGHKPSVDVMFSSIVDQCADQTVAALLTGMGRDGAEGLLALKNVGCPTIAQNESSCVVYGMPRAAVELGAAQQTLPLGSIAKELLKLCK